MLSCGRVPAGLGARQFRQPPQRTPAGTPALRRAAQRQQRAPCVARAPAAAPAWQPAEPAVEALYEHALELSRQERYAEAHAAFEALLAEHPRACRAWVSWAQLLRRQGRTIDPSYMEAARQILQRGLTINPDSGCLAQAWGLMELQRGNFWAAVRLLERSVVMTPALHPVLRWKPVHAARMTVAGSGRRVTRGRARGVACAGAAGAGPGSGPAAGGAAPAAGSSQLCEGGAGCSIVGGGSSTASGGGCMSSM